jgi:UDP:flavonoid glycosyltransferase YjiC (YdhE family)
MTGKRIIIATFGSYGDIHPYIPIALELKERGHTPVMASIPYYRERFEALGVEFQAMRPDLPSPEEDPSLMERGMDDKEGPRVVLQELLMPHLRDTHADLLRIVEGADLLVSHQIVLPAPIVVEQTGIRWVSTMLSPSSFFSAHDPMLPSATGWWGFLRWHPLAAKGFMGFVRRLTELWLKEIYSFRAELGLPRGKHPLFDAHHSPERVLALFSPVFAAPAPDWPPHLTVTGFPFYDKRDAAPIAPELLRFLDAGPPPIVFTLGSAAVWAAGDFYRESLRAAQSLGRRALLLTGDDPRNQFHEPLSEGVAAFPYAPYSEVFPRAAAVVHQGGVGTTGQTLRAGVPALFVPFAHDQPDNAARVSRLGMARFVARKKYNAATAAENLRELLENPAYAQNAAAVGQRVRAEQGHITACDEIEKVLADKSFLR